MQRAFLRVTQDRVHVDNVGAAWVPKRAQPLPQLQRQCGRARGHLPGLCGRVCVRCTRCKRPPHVRLRSRQGAHQQTSHIWGIEGQPAPHRCAHRVGPCRCAWSSMVGCAPGCCPNIGRRSWAVKRASGVRVAGRLAGKLACQAPKWVSGVGWAAWCARRARVRVGKGPVQRAGKQGLPRSHSQGLAGHNRDPAWWPGLPAAAIDLPGPMAGQV
jgi:hypothetical protein